MDEVGAAVDAERAAAALFGGSEEEESDGERPSVEDVEEIDLNHAPGASATPDKHERIDTMLKSAAEMKLAFARRFGRHSRNVSAPPDLHQLAGIRGSLSSAQRLPAAGSPSSLSQRLESAPHSPAEREAEPPRSQGLFEAATGRTGHAPAAQLWLSDAKRQWAARGSSLRAQSVVAQPLPELELLQAEIVLDGWEDLDPETFTRC